jgi:hypothetical protein
MVRSAVSTASSGSRDEQLHIESETHKALQIPAVLEKMFLM